MKILKTISRPLADLYRTLKNGLYVFAALSVIVFYFTNVVVFMRPINGTWCAGDIYVQARFEGYKIRNLRPVPYSWSGQKISDEYQSDALFEFVDDPTPGSSKPWGYNTFGIWRWYVPTVPQRVRMNMEHQGRIDRVYSTFGYYNVPEDIGECSENG